MVTHEAARRAVRTWGRTASAHQSLGESLTRWVHEPSGTLVAYAPARASPFGPAVWVVAGEPIGPPARTAEAAAAFVAHARQRGARTLWFGVERPDLLGIVGPRLVIGAQPWFRVGGWTERLAQKASLRAQVRRARNKGVRVDERPADDVADLLPVLEEWARGRGLPRLSFLADPLVLCDAGDRRLFVASAEGRALAYALVAPIPAQGAWHLEWIVQSAAAPNGTPSLLVDAVCRALPGDADLTLGLVPLSMHAPLSEVAPPLLVRALLRWTRAHARRFYNFEGLERFKAKFLPDRWQPLWLVAPAGITLGTFYAVADAFSGPRGPARLVARALADAVASEASALGRRISWPRSGRLPGSSG